MTSSSSSVPPSCSSSDANQSSYEYVANKSFHSTDEESSDESQLPAKRTRTSYSWKLIKQFNEENEAVDFAVKNSWKYKEG